jgi:diphthine-ammonia ligase
VNSWHTYRLFLDLLKVQGVSFRDITFMTVLISDMNLFTRINQIYKTYFGSDPPGRACVAVNLPEDVNVRLDCLAYAEDKKLDRKALHIQGLSYWAPANIGPYSQAVSVRSHIIREGYVLITNRCRLVVKYSSLVKSG